MKSQKQSFSARLQESVLLSEKSPLFAKAPALFGLSATAHSKRKKEIRRTFLSDMETCSFLNFYRHLSDLLFRQSAFSVGFFLLTWGGVTAFWNLFQKGLPLFAVDFFLPLAVFLSSVSLLRSRETISAELKNSRFLTYFVDIDNNWNWFYSICSKEAASHAPIRSAVWGILFATVSIYFSFWKVLLFLLLLHLAVRIFQKPERIFPLLILTVALGDWIPHSTLALLGTVTLGNLAYLGKTVCGKRQPPKKGIDVLAGMLGCAFFLAALLPEQSVSGLTEALTNGYFLLSGWFLCRGLLTDKHRMKETENLLFWICGVISVLGIWEYASGKSPLKWVDLQRFSDIGGRVCLSFSNPNVFAVFLLLVIPVQVGILCRSKHLSLSLLSLASTTACLLLTWSRGAWLGGLFAAGMFGLLYSAKSRKRTLQALLPIGCCIPLLPSSVRSRFTSIGDLSESSVHYRLLTWNGVRDLIVSHPFGIGCGIDRFREFYLPVAISGTETVPHSHSVPLQLLTELGLPGLLLFLALLFALLRRVCRTLLKENITPHRKSMILALFSALSGSLVMGLFDWIFYRKSLLFLFFSEAAWLCNLTEGEEINDAP